MPEGKRMKHSLPASAWLGPMMMEYVKEEDRSIIDAGFSHGILYYLIRMEHPSVRLVGVDLFDPYLESARKFGIFDEVRKMDLTKAPYPFQTTEFDLAFSTDVIEHLPKEGGKIMLHELERIAKRVVITTDGRFDDNSQSTFDGNQLQKHLSLWTVGDFRRRGYRVKGFGNMKYGPKILGAGLSPVSRVFPVLASKILAVKSGQT